MDWKLFLRKIVVYCIGLFILALGVSISKVSSLGVSPVNSIPAVLSNILHIDMGICTTSVFVVFIFIQICIMRKEFKAYNLFQIIPSFLFGVFVSGTNYLCELFLPIVNNYFMALIYLLISIVFVAIGILFYLNAMILALPGEGVIQAASYKAQIKLSSAKIIFDWSLIIIATLLSLVCLGGLNGIREGTVIAAFGVGTCIKLLESVLEKPLQKLIYKY